MASDQSGFCARGARTGFDGVTEVGLEGEFPLGNFLFLVRLK